MYMRSLTLTAHNSLYMHITNNTTINVDLYRFLAMFSWILMDLQLWLILHSDRCCIYCCMYIAAPINWITTFAVLVSRIM